MPKRCEVAKIKLLPTVSVGKTCGIERVIGNRACTANPRLFLREQTIDRWPECARSVSDGSHGWVPAAIRAFMIWPAQSGGIPAMRYSAIDILYIVDYIYSASDPNGRLL